MYMIWYKELIKKYGLWYSPKMTAKILREAQSYNFTFRPELNVSVFWKDVAAAIGISATAMYKIKRGESFPSQETMKKLVEYFDLNIIGYKGGI